MTDPIPTVALERKVAMLEQLEDLGDEEVARDALVARLNTELAFRRVLIRIFDESQEVT